MLSNVSFWSGVPDARGKTGENLTKHDAVSSNQVDADQFFAVSPLELLTFYVLRTNVIVLSIISRLRKLRIVAFFTWEKQV